MMDAPAAITLAPIGVLRSPWPDKFAIPRQSGLSELEAVVELDRERIPAEALRGLEQVSHVWLLCWLHASVADGWRPTVRPPRLGGSARLGVLATRAPHRPNPIGLTLVRLLAIDDRRLTVRGADLLDGTPVLDVKPHLPWAEQPRDATCEWAPDPPRPLAIRYAPAAEPALAARPELRRTIEQTLRWDPRPAHQRDDPGRSFVAVVLDVDVRFRVDAAGVEILAITRLEPS